MTNESTIDIPGFKIAYKAWGNKEAPPLFALHGWLDNANSFELLAPKLAKSFYVIAIDLPGHGLSSHLPLGCYYHFSDSIFTLIEIIKAFKFKKIHLLGHSMGACIASLVGGVAPQYIDSLVFIEALGPFSAKDTTCAEQLANYLHSDLEKKISPAKPYPSLELAAIARAQAGYLEPRYAKILCERGLREENGAYYWRHDRRLLIKSPLRMTEKQVLSCLKKIKAKTCYIYSAQGFPFDKELLEQRINAIPHLETHCLSGGHHIHMEKAEEVAELLENFYKKFISYH